MGSRQQNQNLNDGDRHICIFSAQSHVKNYPRFTVLPVRKLVGSTQFSIPFEKPEITEPPPKQKATRRRTRHIVIAPGLSERTGVKTVGRRSNVQGKNENVVALVRGGIFLLVFVLILKKAETITLGNEHLVGTEMRKR